MIQIIADRLQSSPSATSHPNYGGVSGVELIYSQQSDLALVFESLLPEFHSVP